MVLADDLRKKVDSATATYEMIASMIMNFIYCIFTADSPPPCGHCIIGASLLTDTQNQSRPDSHCSKYLTPQLPTTVRLSNKKVIITFDDYVLIADSSPPCDHLVIRASHLSDTQSRPDNHPGKCYLLSTPQLPAIVRLSSLSDI